MIYCILQWPYKSMWQGLNILQLFLLTIIQRLKQNVDVKTTKRPTTLMGSTVDCGPLMGLSWSEALLELWKVLLMTHKATQKSFREKENHPTRTVHT